MRVGIDVQSVSEVHDALVNFGDRYRQRLFTDAEIADCGGWGAPPMSSAPSLAGRFAAKEATLKALRVDNLVPNWRDIEIVRERGGWPSLRLHALAAEIARDASLTAFDVSVSHTEGIASAIVIAC